MIEVLYFYEYNFLPISHVGMYYMLYILIEVPTYTAVFVAQLRSRVQILLTALYFSFFLSHTEICHCPFTVTLRFFLNSE